MKKFYTIKVTYLDKNGKEQVEMKEIATSNKKSIREAFACALQYTTGVGNEDYFKWDDPDVLENTLLKMELVEN